VTGKPPVVAVCGKDYVFNANPVDPRQKLVANARCPQLDVPDNIEVAVAAKEMRDETAYQVALAEIKLQEKLQQQAPSGAETIMTASIQKDEGSAEGYRSDADANRVLGSQVAEAALKEEPAPADFATDATAADGQTEPTVAADTSGSNLPSVATAFSGVWGKLVGMTGLRSLSGAGDDEPKAKTEDGDPMTTGTVPVPNAKPSDKSAALSGGLPPLTPATAFLPVIVNDDPFAIFDFFQDVNGVSVPADIVRR
jgi:hypothetical protein